MFYMTLQNTHTRGEGEGEGPCGMESRREKQNIYIQFIVPMMYSIMIHFMYRKLNWHMFDWRSQVSNLNSIVACTQ
jgi:hypothetical protein